MSAAPWADFVHSELIVFCSAHPFIDDKKKIKIKKRSLKIEKIPLARRRKVDSVSNLSLYYQK